MSQSIEAFSDSDIELFRDALLKLFDGCDGAGSLRRMRQAENESDFDLSLWKGVCEHSLLPSPMGEFEWSNLPLLSEVFRSMGEKLVTLPLLESVLSHVLLACLDLPLNGLDAASLCEGRQRLIPLQLEAAVSGATCDALQLIEGRLSGSCEAPFTRTADGFVVVAQSDKGLCIALVPNSQVEQQFIGVGLDGARRYRVRFEEIALEEDMYSTDPMAIERAFNTVSCIANALLGAQLQGLGEAAFSKTLEWLKTREQFGALIGSFQALQHRAVRCFASLEKMKALNAHNLGQIVDASKAKLAFESKIFSAVSATALTAESIQLHGGIGMTDECDIGFYFKTAHALAHRYGSPDSLLEKTMNA